MDKFDSWLRTEFELDPRYELVRIGTEKDKLGYKHYRYQQTFNNIPIEFTMFLTHAKDGLIHSMNGMLIKKLNESSPAISEEEAFKIALYNVKATLYKWVDENTPPPSGELVYVPVDADFAVTRTKEANVLRGRVESAREFHRQKAPPRRVFVLVFHHRAKSDWDLIEEFRLKMLNAGGSHFFTYDDKTAGRKYSVYFDAEPVYEEAGNETHNIRVQLIEAAGVAMNTYPSFAAGNPSVNLPVSQATDLGANGKQWLYAGYGYRVNGTFSQIYLDEVLTGGENPKTDVVLALHRVRVVGGAPTSIDYLI